MMYKISFCIIVALISSICNAQKKECDISFKVYQDFFKGKFNRVFFADKLNKYETGNFVHFKNKYGNFLSQEELQTLYKKANELKKRDDIRMCSIDSLMISGERIKQIFKEYELEPIIDSSKEDSIKRKINEILSRPDEDEKYKLYNEYMESKEVVQIREQKNYRYPRIVYLSRPIFFKTVAMVHVEVIVPHQLWYGFTGIYRKMKDTWNLIKSFPD